MGDVARALWDAVLHAHERKVLTLVHGNEDLLFLRGPVGEQPIHMCFLYNTLHHKRLARILLNEFPAIAACTYVGPVFDGESCLHIAIVNKDKAAVKLLLETSPALVNGRAIGTFFSREKLNFGELPICFAACTGQKDMVSALLHEGADLRCADSNGNTLLHLMVLHSNSEMYDYILSEEAKQEHTEGKSLSLIENNDGLTPFCLAAATGNEEMFTFLIEKDKLLLWTYGPVMCHLYPLDHLDHQLLDNTESTRKSAIECIIDNERLNLLTHPRVSDLLDKKWATFGHRMFNSKLKSTLAFLLILTVSIILRRSDSGGTLMWGAHCLADLLTLFGVVQKAWCELQEMFRHGVRTYFSGSGCALLENVLSLAACITISIAFALRSVESDYEILFMAGGSLLSWSYLLYFPLGFRETGPLIVMLIKMIRIDLFRFLVVSGCFLLGFSQAFFILYEERGVKQYTARVSTSFLGLLGDFNFEEYSKGRFSIANSLLLLLFIVTVTILLLNLLIAMMGDTYSTVSAEAGRQWQLERARMIFSLESEMDPEQRHNSSDRYWREVDGKRYLQVETRNDKYFELPPADPSPWEKVLPTNMGSPPPPPAHAFLRAKLAVSSPRKPSATKSGWNLIFSAVTGRASADHPNAPDSTKAGAPPPTKATKNWGKLRAKMPSNKRALSLAVPPSSDHTPEKASCSPLRERNTPLHSALKSKKTPAKSRSRKVTLREPSPAVTPSRRSTRLNNRT